MKPALKQFRTELQRLLSLVDWEPDEAQLERFARQVAAQESLSPDQLERLFCAQFPDTLRAVVEGLDNSDLRTSLQLAINAARQRSQ